MVNMSSVIPEFIVDKNEDRCIKCKVCVRQCSEEVFKYFEDFDLIRIYNDKCVGCHRCEMMCPTDALTITKNKALYKDNFHWSAYTINSIKKQAETGGMTLTGSGNDKAYVSYWDRMLLDASQVTNPPIDPLREPMELRTYLGKKPDRILLKEENGEISLDTKLAPQIKLETPIMFSAMSYGSISLNACESLASAASRLGTFYNTGEGGLHKKLYKYGKNTIGQVASGRFGVDTDYLAACAAIEIKIGQGAKPGIGGHLPGEKVTVEISETRMIPSGTDAISPAPHHDIYSIEDLKQLISLIKEATNYEKPVFVKIAAVHNSAAIASGIVRAGADVIVIDGFRGGTGAAPSVIRDNTGIPIEIALAVIDQRLRDESIRNEVSIVAAGGIRSSADAVKAMALGADAVYIATAALIAMGCTLCQKCYKGKCNWGLTTQDPVLTRRLNPEIGSEKLTNLVNSWNLEIKEILGSMGINAIEALRGNRLRLRGVGLTELESKILGIEHAGM
jgi:glutamate synthase domain-containing protein 2